MAALQNQNESLNKVLNDKPEKRDISSNPQNHNYNTDEEELVREKEENLIFTGS